MRIYPGIENSWVWRVVVPPWPFEICKDNDGSHSIFANIAIIIDETASASHRCGYLENIAFSLSARCNITNYKMACVCQTQSKAI